MCLGISFGRDKWVEIICIQGSQCLPMEYCLGLDVGFFVSFFSFMSRERGR